ncbi:MAG: tetratricopeptide repeat protein [Candidatus Aureabacteria bacterium]|nr:tetratricopeptide repeat protein [Candidatus Auribacterota bacterium]
MTRPRGSVPPSRRPDSRRTAHLLVAILVLAFVLRFVFFYQMARSPIAEMVIEDSKTYDDWGREIARGNWLGQEVFYALPLYGYFLGGIYALFGPHLQAAKFIQVLMGSANCYFLFLIGRRLFNPAVALLAAFSMAVYGWLIVYDSAILSPVLIIFLELLLLLYLLRLRESNRGWTGYLGAGLLLGLLAAVSAPALLLAALVLIRVLADSARAWKPRIAAALALLLGFCLLPGLITYRNWRVGGDPVFLTAHGGINFFIGNNPAARGVFEPPPILSSGGATLREDSAKIAEKDLGRRLKPSEVSSYWFKQGFSFIRNQRVRFFVLFLNKLAIYWDGLEVADVIHPFFFRDFAPVLKIPLLVFPIVSPVALLGIILSWRERRRLLPLYLFLAAYLFSTALYFINSRYRLPAVPFLLLFFAYTPWWWRERYREKRWHLIPLSLVLLLALVFFTSPGLAGKPRFVLNLGAGYNHLGTFYSQKGDIARALKEFQRALELEPYRAEAHYNLGNIHLKQGAYAAAISAYREAIRLNPFYESARLSLGLAYEGTGEKDRARREYQEVIQNLPRNPPAYLRLSQLLVSENKYDDAIAILNRLLSLQPQSSPAYLYLAFAQEKKGNPEAARDALNRGLAADPGAGMLHLELARVLGANFHDETAALAHLKEAVRLMPDNYFAHLYLGDSLLRQKDVNGALREWAAAGAIRPGDEAVAERRRSVGN